MDVVADLGQGFAVDLLQGQAAVADEFARFPERHRPQAEPVFFIVFQAPRDPAPGLFLVVRRGIVPHGFRVRKNFVKRVKIVPGVFPQDQPFRFDHRFSSPDPFLHPDAAERVPLREFAAGRVAHPQVEIHLVVAAFQHRFFAAELRGPFFAFTHDPRTDALMPVFGQHHHPPDHHALFVQRVHPRRGDGEIRVRDHDILRFGRIVGVELLPERDMVLFRHGLDAHVVRPRLLPRFRRPDDLHAFSSPFRRIQAFPFYPFPRGLASGFLPLRKITLEKGADIQYNTSSTA